MGWKNWPYWIKGGILGAVLVLTLYMLISFAYPFFIQNAFISDTLYVINIILALPVIFIPQLFPAIPENTIVGISIFLITWAIMGAIIGLIIDWIIKKRKSKNNTSTRSNINK